MCLLTFADEEQLSRAFEESRRTWEGWRYVMRFCRRAAGGELQLNGLQAKVLGRYCN